jgi:hypothetical protein
MVHKILRIFTLILFSDAGVEVVNNFTLPI